MTTEIKEQLSDSVSANLKYFKIYFLAITYKLITQMCINFDVLNKNLINLNWLAS